MAEFEPDLEAISIEAERRPFLRPVAAGFSAAAALAIVMAPNALANATPATTFAEITVQTAADSTPQVPQTHIAYGPTTINLPQGTAGSEAGKNIVESHPELIAIPAGLAALGLFWIIHRTGRRK